VIDATLTGNSVSIDGIPNFEVVRPRHFRAVGSEVELGALLVMRKAFDPMRLLRVDEPAEETGPGDAFQLLVPLQGRVHASWGDRQTTARTGELLLHDATRVTVADFEPGDGEGMFHTAAVNIPRSLISLPDEHVERVLGRGIPAGDGLAALLACFVTNVADNAGSYKPADGPRVGMALVDLVSAMLANTLESEGSLDPGSHRHALTVRIQSFVQRNLREPGLSPGSLAAAHHISISYLHRLFQEQGTTVAGWIRAQRLERARRDLADPALRHLPIHGIATSWGFSHAADFSRAFRKAFGVPPRDYRHEALCMPG
jgi:AraC-like DNA-binding protein